MVRPKEVSTDAQLMLLSLSEVSEQVDPLAADLDTDPALAGLGALPYQQLLGPGFERLCYELLVAEGYSPRFFGRRGQKDYGVDIVVEAGERRTVYQCKNLVDAPQWTEVRNAVAKFESDWLGKAELPRPNGYVYCCPHPLDDIALGAPWTHYRDEFHKRTGVEVSFLDRHGLDTRLRRLPDIVAGLFSGSYAEHFCNRDGWVDDPWVRVRWGESRHASIKRFLDRHRRSVIYISAEVEDHFRNLWTSARVLAIRGVPGSGKTLTSLELACRLRDSVRSIYYATLNDSSDPQRLWQSVRRRCSLPALFVLDDCHLGLEQAGILLERLAPELSDPRGMVKLLLILRDVPGLGSEGLDDTPDWLLELKQNGLVIDMKTDLRRTRAVTEHLRPEWTGLSKQRLERLHYISGGDLLLLDEILSAVASPPGLDVMQPDHLYGPLRSCYFRGNRRLPTIRRLACLAQFELVPLASFLDSGWQQGEKDFTTPLMTEFFAPPRYQFLHSSLAELVLRALLELDVRVARVEEAVAEVTTTALIAYLRHLIASSVGDAADDAMFLASMETLLHGRLHLLESAAEVRIKASVLADETIRSEIEANLHHCTFTLLHICLVILTTANHPAKAHYAELVATRFGLLFQHEFDRYDAAGLATVGIGFFTLVRNAPSALIAVQEEYGASRFLRLISANGTLFELFQILEYATPAFREALLAQLDEITVTALVDKTIAAGRSIGTLHLALRELSDTDLVLLGRLEEAIGASRFLRLISANGTLFELFQILRHTTPAFREALLAQLDEVTVTALVDKTIAAGRSIEWFHFALRGLAHTPPQRERLEQLVGIRCWCRLVIGVGTLNSLGQITDAMSDDFRSRFIEASSALTALDWQSILARGLFLDTCTFAAEKLAAYPATSQAAFRDALGQTAASLAAKASWFDLNPSRPPADPAEGRILREALQARIAEIKLDDLVGLDFREAVNGFAFSWRERPDLRPTLGVQLWEILPDPAEWPREEGKVAAVRLILAIARSPMVSAQDAQRLLTAVGSFLDHEVCTDIHTWPLFLLLWNIAALHYERGTDRAFDRTLPDALIETLLDVLRKRIRPKSPNTEKLAQLALVGLLGFLVPIVRTTLQRILTPLTKSAPWLRQQALEQTFVPALFALEGIALLRFDERVFTPSVCLQLLGKSEEYEDLGPAIEHLRDRVKRYGEPR